MKISTQTSNMQLCPKVPLHMKYDYEDMLLGKTSKKINGKENDIVQKVGEVSEKNQILNVLLKETFY